ncbi:MAG: Glu-tRNA(Gln) amidotransferase subunit GatE [Candidatus Diapherotrites archaeon]|nr:Glu-tRNA(Gln) amidotransferase subunit GatE [Candidatus Diapherotrites archaeon]
MDYSAIGFKAGLEVHQQLDTEHKLFCDCPTKKSGEFPFEIRRKMRAVAGELGDIDIAAKAEFEKGLIFVYKFNPESTCLVELDCEPPHAMSEEALDVTLQMCKLLGSEIADEVLVMRKTVVDGSNTSGFQRTALVGRGGVIQTSKGPVRITNVQLEEDAATPMEKTDKEVVYRLDRLGVPLIELGTQPDIVDPQHLKETALKIGALFRATGKAKRGIGSIRQDLNISIRGGARVEIKGAQEPRLFPLIAEREVQRQLALLEVRDVLKKRKARVGNVTEVTGLFKNSKCKFMSKAPCVLALSLYGFAGVLGKEVQPGRRVGTELSDYAKLAGVGGIIHSDENLSKYGISEGDLLRKKLGLGVKDAFVLVASSKEKARRAIELARKRASMLAKFIPKEVRRGLPDGNTSFMRPMPGAARLYPETDCPPIVLTESRLKRVKVPEKPEETFKKLLKAGLSRDLAEKLVNSSNLGVFKKIKSKNPALVASTLEDSLTALRREGVDVEQISDEHIIELFKLYEKGLFAKESIPEILTTIAKEPGKPIKDIVDKLKFFKMSKVQVEEAVRRIVSKNVDALNSPKAFSIVMGEVMKELRGKADGGLIAKIVKEEIKKRKG